MGLFSRNSNKGGTAAVTPPAAPPLPTMPASKIPASVIASPPPGLMPNSDAQDSVASRLAAASSQAQVVNNERQVAFQRMKVRIHQQLVQRLDVQNLRALPTDTVRHEVRVIVRELCNLERGLLSGSEQERLMDEVMDETFGLGPLESLLKDPLVSDILVNRFDKIYVERRGRIEPAPDVRFRDNAHLRQIIDRIVAQ